MKYFYTKLLTQTIIFIISVITNSAHAEEKAKWATSRYASDIEFVVVDDRNAPKWYIGECSGDITLRSDRIKIYEAEHKGAGVEEVQLVSEKYYADRIFCIK